jgi:hypothetical protein
MSFIEPEPIRLICFGCGKAVSTEVPGATIVRAVLICPECVPQMLREDAPTIFRAPMAEAE